MMMHAYPMNPMAAYSMIPYDASSFRVSNYSPIVLKAKTATTIQYPIALNLDGVSMRITPIDTTVRAYLVTSATQKGTVYLPIIMENNSDLPMHIPAGSMIAFVEVIRHFPNALICVPSMTNANELRGVADKTNTK